ncbi:MAG: molybdopterin-dependent oxidoreductase, partial [Chloroflexi bacterium]|nr:molybdopterin-dependent oxidoreductase [Chloroflexota bacterium]
MTAEQAQITTHLPATAAEAAEKTGFSEDIVQEALDTLVRKGVVYPRRDPGSFRLAFDALMLHDTTLTARDIDMVKDRKLFDLWEDFSMNEQYVNLGKKYAEFPQPPWRVVPAYKALEGLSNVSPSDDFRELLKLKAHETISVIPCPCRLRKAGIEEPCDHSEEDKHWVCFQFGRGAVYAIARGAAREVSAEEALSLIDVDYEVLPHTLDPEVAMQNDAPLLHETLHTKSQHGTSDEASNLAEHWELSRGDVERGFAEADSIIEESFSTQVVHHGYVEPDAETALVHPDGTVEVWANTQSIYSTRSDIAVLLDIPLGDITVNPTELGGAFGGKETLRASGMCVMLSKKALLPVQIRFTREEVFRGTGPGNSIRSTVKIGARSDGTITAIQARMVFDAGAFPGAPLRSAIRRVFSHYRTPNLKIDAYDVVTNKPHVAAYRAPGATPTAFAVESVIDDLARSLSIDLLEFRLQNVSQPGDPMPDGDLLTSVNFIEVLNRVKQHECWTSPIEGKNRGRGLALGMWTMPGGTASCHVNLNGDGSVTLVIGTPDLSGTRTSLGLVAAESLGLDLSDVKVTIANTDAVAYSDASAGDRITYIASIAIGRACASLIDSIKERVAKEFNVSPDDIDYNHKSFTLSGVPEMGVSWGDMALRSVRGEGALSAAGAASEIPDGAAIAPNAAAHVVDVKVDPETGK